MLTPLEIEKMMQEIGIRNDEDRSKFVEWSKQTLRPQTEKKLFIRLTNITVVEEEGKEQEDGKLE